MENDAPILAPVLGSSIPQPAGNRERGIPLNAVIVERLTNEVGSGATVSGVLRRLIDDRPKNAELLDRANEL